MCVPPHGNDALVNIVVERRLRHCCPEEGCEILFLEKLPETVGFFHDGMSIATATSLFVTPNRNLGGPILLYT